MIKPSSLGDIIHALPVLHGLRQRYPCAHIAWLAARSFAPLLADHPELDEVIEFDRRRFGRVGRSVAVSIEFARFLGRLRRRRFDLVIDLQGLFRSGFLAWSCRAPVRIGFGSAREMAWTFYTHRIPARNPDTHAVDRNYEVSVLLGFEEVPKITDMALTDAERTEGRRMLSSSGLATGEVFAALLPGARWETKQWPPERFAAVADRLSAEGLRTVLMGGPEERPRCAHIAASCRVSPMNLAGRTSLRQLAAILEQASVVLCHDSGPMHLASALNRPLLSMVGPTNPRRTGPYGRPGAVLRVDLPCSPCYLRRLAQCGHGHECMRAVSLDLVWARLREILELAPLNADK